MESALFETQDLFDIKGRGVVITGSLKSGTLQAGMTTVINNHKAEVRGFEVFGKTLTTVSSTDPEAKAVGVLLANVTTEDLDPFLKENPLVTFSSTTEPDINLSQPVPPVIVTPLDNNSTKIILIIGFLALLAVVCFWIFSGRLS